MRSLFQVATYLLLGLAVLFSISMEAPVTAHENHSALGAGPGPADEDVTNMHENMATGHEQAMEAHEKAADANRTFGQRLVSWLGRLHTLVIHFPIAMFVGALAVELYGLWRRDSQYRTAAYVMLVVGAIGAIVAAFLGWFAGGFYLTDRNIVLMVHRWLGTALALFAFILVLIAARARRAPDRPRRLYWAFLALMTAAIAVQGYLGGTFMHGGMNHMAF